VFLITLKEYLLKRRKVLSGNIPFCQYRTEGLVSTAVGRGEKPIRPSQDNISGDEIDVIMWHSMSRFWELEPRGRPSCLKFREILSSMGIHYDRLKVEPVRQPRGLELMKLPAIDSERAQAILTNLLPPATQIPEPLRSVALGIVRKRMEDVAASQEKVCISNSDTQTLLGFLDLVRFYPLVSPYSSLMPCFKDHQTRYPFFGRTVPRPGLPFEDNKTKPWRCTKMRHSNEDRQ
jgi:hypothetical protein